MRDKVCKVGTLNGYPYQLNTQCLATAVIKYALTNFLSITFKPNQTLTGVIYLTNTIYYNFDFILIHRVSNATQSKNNLKQSKAMITECNRIETNLVQGEKGDNSTERSIYSMLFSSSVVKCCSKTMWNIFLQSAFTSIANSTMGHIPLRVTWVKYPDNNHIPNNIRYLRVPD